MEEGSPFEAPVDWVAVAVDVAEVGGDGDEDGRATQCVRQ